MEPISPQAQSRSRSIQAQLAILRYAVVLQIEGNGDIVESRGLGEQGQQDLQFIFPRTARLAALTHAVRVVRGIFDTRVRDRGFYHILRLPAPIESQLHALYLTSQILKTEQPAPLGLLEEVAGQPASGAMAKEGPVNVGLLDLGKRSDVQKLAQVHADAVAGGKFVIPFFQMG